MTAALILVAVLVVVVTPILWIKYGAVTGLFALVLVTLALVPRRLFALGELREHAGIATSSILISTFTVAIALATVYCLGRRIFKVPIPFVIFIAFTGLLMEPAWGATIEQFSGWVHLVVALLAWGVGYGLSRTLDVNGHASTQWAAVLTWILAAQLIVVAVTLSGVELPAFITLTDTIGARAVGTLGNAATLSKITFFFLILLLPLTSSALRATRRWAGVGVALSLVLTGLTVSRANMVAVAILVAVWSLLVPGRVSIQVRLLMIALGTVAVSFFAGPFIERFDDDRTGGLRPALLEAALNQIQQNPWIGVGPNSYVQTVGETDPTTALGFPVHNAYLLMIAEVGIPLAVLFFLPFVHLIFKALKRRKVPGSVGAFSWALLGAAPGLIAITVTGWGMLSGFTLCLWMLISGVVAAQIDRAPRSEDHSFLTPAMRRQESPSDFTA